MGWRTGGSEFQFMYNNELFLLHVTQTASRAQPVSYPMDTAGLFPELKWPGSETGHSSPIITEVKKKWVYTPTPA
jgi:hypothetical protein